MIRMEYLVSFEFDLDLGKKFRFRVTWGCERDGGFSGRIEPQECRVKSHGMLAIG